MNKDSLIDCSAYILVKLLGALVRSLPIGFSLFLGRRLGECLYYFDFKHKCLAYANIKSVFADKFTPSQLSKITKDFYRNLGQNLIDIFLIPLVNQAYLEKYLTFEGLENIEEAFEEQKGTILLGVHAGSWELSNIICASMGFPFVLLVRDLRHPRLNELLNSYRKRQGCRLIQRKSQTRQLIEAIKKNQAIGMTVDQGGKHGTLVRFFGRQTSMASGAVRLALKYDAAILAGFYARIKGPYVKVFIEPHFKITKSQDFEKDVQDNLQRLVAVYEKYILRYPAEYLWSYKIWKYSDSRNILILSDGKTGHLRQSQAIAEIISDYFKEKGITCSIDILDIEYRNKHARLAMMLSACLAGKYHCQGCLRCLRAFLKRESYSVLLNLKPDIVISCGASLAPINFVVSRENLARSIVVMRPSILSTKRFNLVVMPKHDNPPKRKNVVITEGALNLIDEKYLKEQSEKLKQNPWLKLQGSNLCIGLLIGGDTKNFRLENGILSEIIKQLKSASEMLGADILVTTSRRTSPEAEDLVRKELGGFPFCKLLVIANENNIPEAVGGILGLSHIVITSPESISMISEAVNSNKYVLVFNVANLRKKHREFIKYFTKNKYIYLTEPIDLSAVIKDIWLSKPKLHTPRDSFLINEAVGRFL